MRKKGSRELFCWKCGGSITGPWRTVFPKVAKCRRVGISERMKATRLQRHGAVVCESCYACYDSNGNERPELQLLSEAAEPAVPVLGVDILPGGGTDEG